MLVLIGILLTVVFGILSIVAFYSQYVTKIVFIQEDLINLYDKVTRNIEELKITFKKKQINEYMYLLRGFLFCVGKRDITRDKIEKDLYIKLPEGSIWHDSKILSKSEGLKVNLESVNNKLTIGLGLFKNEEFLYLEGLFESQKPEIGETLISFFHRIANIGKVERLELSYYKNPLKTIFQLLLIPIVLSTFYIGILPLKLESYNLNPSFYKDGKPVQLPSDPPPRIIKTDDGIQVVTHRPLKIFRLEEKAVKEHKYFDLVFNKNIKEYKLDDVYTVKFYMESKFDFYLFIIVSFMIFISLAISFIAFLIYLGKKKILNIARIEIEKKQKKVRL